MRLRRAIAVEIVAHLVAEGQDAEQLARGGEIALTAGIEALDDAAQFGQVLAHPRLAVHRLDRAIEKAVRLAGRLADFLLPHGGDRIDAAAEFGAVDVLRDQLGDEAVDLLLQLAARLVVDWDQPAAWAGATVGTGSGGVSVSPFSWVTVSAVVAIVQTLQIRVSSVEGMAAGSSVLSR